LTSQRDFLSDVKAGATNVRDNAIFPSPVRRAGESHGGVGWELLGGNFEDYISFDNTVNLSSLIVILVQNKIGRVIITSGSRTRPSHSCDGWVGDLGVVGVLSIFGFARRAGTGVFAGGILTFVLPSGFQLAQHNRGQYHFRNAAFSSQLETMVGGALPRASVLCVGLGVGGTTITDGVWIE
jgi:hypothetical protein